MRYLRWLQEQSFDHPAHQIALQEMVDAVRVAKERMMRLEEAIAEFVASWSLGPLVVALQALRGVNLIVAVTFVAEIGDVSRFDNPRQLMGYLGLVPGERSTGDTIRKGGITKPEIAAFAASSSRAPGRIDTRPRLERRNSTGWKPLRRRCARSPGRHKRA